MKKLSKILVAAMLVFPVCSFAQGGFVQDGSAAPVINKGTYTQLTTVAAAKQQADDVFVLLEGYITGPAKSLNPQEFMFEDGSGEIKIEVNQKVWRNQKVTPSIKVRILGQVDHNPVARTTEIEVRQLDIVQ